MALSDLLDDAAKVGWKNKSTSAVTSEPETFGSGIKVIDQGSERGGADERECAIIGM